MTRAERAGTGWERFAWPWMPWVFLYGCTGALTFARVSPCSPRPSLCVARYWLEFWLLDYSSGIHRRGFLASVVRLLAPRYLDIVVMNVIALTICSAILVTLAVMLLRSAEDFWGKAAVAILLASPVSSVFLEILGDPLQVDFALLLVWVFAVGRTRSMTARYISAAVLCVVMVLIHEAAVFLFAPAIILLVKPQARVNRGTYAACAALAVALLAGVLLIGSIPRQDHQSYHAMNSSSGAVIARVPDALPPLRGQVEAEVRRYFGSPGGFLGFVMKFPRSWFVPCLALILAAGTLWRADRGRLLRTYWWYLTLCSIPLYAVAHDWGRFSAYTLWLALFVTWHALRDASTAVQPAPSRDGLAARLFPKRLPDPGIVVAVIGFLILVVQQFVNRSYWVDGVPTLSLVVLCPVVVTAWVAWARWSQRSEAFRTYSHSRSTGSSGP